MLLVILGIEEINYWVVVFEILKVIEESKKNNNNKKKFIVYLEELIFNLFWINFCRF